MSVKVDKPTCTQAAAGSSVCTQAEEDTQHQDLGKALDGEFLCAFPPGLAPVACLLRAWGRAQKGSGDDKMAKDAPIPMGWVEPQDPPVSHLHPARPPW